MTGIQVNEKMICDSINMRGKILISGFTDINLYDFSHFNFEWKMMNRIINIK